MLVDKNLLEFLKKTVLLYFPNIYIKIYLFGSRARKQNLLKSDYDIAFDIPPEINDFEFLLNITENAPTLCLIDAVNINKVTEPLRTSILKEGILIYESK